MGTLIGGRAFDHQYWNFNGSDQFSVEISGNLIRWRYGDGATVMTSLRRRHADDVTAKIVYLRGD